MSQLNMSISMEPTDNGKEVSTHKEKDEGFLSGKNSSSKYSQSHTIDSIENWTFDETDSEEDDGYKEDFEIIQEERENKCKVANNQHTRTSQAVRNWLAIQTIKQCHCNVETNKLLTLEKGHLLSSRAWTMNTV